MSNKLHASNRPDEKFRFGLLASRASIKLNDADAVISAVCEHMTEHGATIARDADVWIFRFPNATATFVTNAEMTTIEVAADDAESLYFIRLSVASHMVEFGPPDLALVWEGDAGALLCPPNFQKLEVLGMKNVTPAMRRITFSAEDVSKFVSMDALHVNLILQHEGSIVPQWPIVGANGLIAWEGDVRRPFMRKYTVRSLDPNRGTLDIDFVIHSDAGPGSRFAEVAQVGDVIGVLGPGGGGLVEANWYLFAGDETALPAIARMLERLLPTASATVVIDVANESEIQDLCCRGSLEIRWLLRDNGPSGNLSEFEDSVLGVAFPDEEERIYVWVGCEFQKAQAIRKALKSNGRLARRDQLIVSYWRRGEAESH